jgi:hypothetical protein
MNGGSPTSTAPSARRRVSWLEDLAGNEHHPHERVSCPSEPSTPERTRRDDIGRLQFSHIKGLGHSAYIRSIRLPAYGPELNFQEHIWDELHEKEFPNRGFANMPSVIRQLENGMPRLAGDSNRLRSITGWPWIVSLDLKVG